MNPQDNFRATSAQPPTDPSAPPQGAPIGGPQGAPYQPPQPGYAPQPYGYGQGISPVGNREFASWGIRVGAALIDGLFALITLGIGGIVNWFLPGRQGQNNGQTLGKQLCGIRVVKEQGMPLSMGDAVVRELLVKGLLFGWLSGLLLFLPLLADVLWPLGDDNKQALHDKIVSTYVVQG